MYGFVYGDGRGQCAHCPFASSNFGRPQFVILGCPQRPVIRCSFLLTKRCSIFLAERCSKLLAIGYPFFIDRWWCVQWCTLRCTKHISIGCSQSLAINSWTNLRESSEAVCRSLDVVKKCWPVFTESYVWKKKITSLLRYGFYFGNSFTPSHFSMTAFGNRLLGLVLHLPYQRDCCVSRHTSRTSQTSEIRIHTAVTIKRAGSKCSSSQRQHE